MTPIDSQTGAARSSEEEHFRLIVEATTPNAMVLVEGGERGRITLVNAQAERLFGYTRQELLGQSIERLVPPRFRPMGAGRNLLGLRKDGTEVPIKICLTPVETPKGLFTLASILDINERKQVEQIVSEAGDYAEGIVQTVREPLVVLDLELRVVSANRAFYQTFQVTPEATQGQRVYDLGNGQWDIPKLRTLLEDVLPTHTSFQDFEVEHEFPSLGHRVMLLNARRIYRRIDEAPLSLLAIEDITTRRRAEAEIAAKSKELETLLYVTTHDLSEPLRSIENFSHMVLDEHGGRLDEEGQDLLRRVVKGGARMRLLLNDILTFSRVRRITPPTEEVRGEVLVREALDGLEATIQETKAKVQVAKDLPRLRADRTWTTQAVYNLVSNALKFTRPGEPPEVEIAAYRPAPGDTDGEGFVVRDRGPGVAPEHAERIFELFQRAVGHEVQGTGAGLAIVRSVAERHGGKTWVRPRTGGGSEFIVTFGKKRK